MHFKYTKLCTFKKNVHIEYKKLSPLFECKMHTFFEKKKCTQNKYNCAHYLKNYVHWLYEIVYNFLMYRLYTLINFGRKYPQIKILCIMKIQNCIHSLKNYIR